MPPAQIAIHIPNVSVAALRAGNGPRLLFLHDELSSDWTPFLDLLAERFEVTAPELPGFGCSERPEWADTIDDLAFAVADLTDALAPTAIVGASLGGWLAIEAAVRGAPATALVAIGAPGIDLHGDPPADYFVLMQHERPAFFFDNPECAPDVDEDTSIRNESMTARLVWQPRYVNPALTGRLHRVRAPTLVVWGANDRFLSRAHGEALANGAPDGRLAVVDNAGHFPAREQPEATAALVAGFLNDLPSPSGRGQSASARG
ncbi:MAG: alpha/beta hydrolase [Chloroflexota bacterium]|nr:alpha/beta hydrolase [Chloroflexota bacterium]